jgi:Flp pilus assembly pilin Flp
MATHGRPITFGRRSLVATLCRDNRGAVMPEYAVLLGVVVMVSSVALVKLGQALVTDFHRGRGLVMYPVP